MNPKGLAETSKSPTNGRKYGATAKVAFGTLAEGNLEALTKSTSSALVASWPLKS